MKQLFTNEEMNILTKAVERNATSTVKERIKFVEEEAKKPIWKRNPLYKAEVKGLKEMCNYLRGYYAGMEAEKLNAKYEKINETGSSMIASISRTEETLEAIRKEDIEALF